MRLGHRSLVRSRPTGARPQRCNVSAASSWCSLPPLLVATSRTKTPCPSARRGDEATNIVAQSGSAASRPAPPATGACGKAIRKRSAIVSFTALPLLTRRAGVRRRRATSVPTSSRPPPTREIARCCPPRMPSPPTLADLLNSTQERPPAATRCAATIANDLAQAVLVSQAQVLVEEHETCMVSRQSAGGGGSTAA